MKPPIAIAESSETELDAELEQFAAALGRAVRAARGLRGWTQDEVARRAYLTTVTISNMERGRLSNLRTFLTVANVLGTRASDLWKLAEAGSSESPEVRSLRPLIEAAEQLHE